MQFFIFFCRLLSVLLLCLFFFNFLSVLDRGKMHGYFVVFKPKQYDFDCLDNPSKYPPPPSRPPKSMSVSSSGSPPRPPKPSTYSTSSVENEVYFAGNAPIVPPRRRNSPSAFVEQQDLNGSVAHQMSPRPVATRLPSTDGDADKDATLKRSPVFPHRALSPSNSNESSTTLNSEAHSVRE